jgi:hypothetical protein
VLSRRASCDGGAAAEDILRSIMHGSLRAWRRLKLRVWFIAISGLLSSA